MIKRGDIIELTIESLAFGAEGIGRVLIDEKPFTIFVEDTVPGDVVKVKVGRKKKNYAYGYVQEFIKYAPQRIAARCKHFGVCGGCSLQFLSYEEQLATKEQQVKDAVRRIGGLDERLVKPIIGVKEPWFYRNKMEFSFSENKKEESVRKIDLGLHLKHMHHDVVELTECFLLSPYIGDFVTTVREFFRKLYSETQWVGGPELRSLVVREGKHTGEVMVHLSAENGDESFIKEQLTAVLENFKTLTVNFFKAQVTPQKLVSIYFTHIQNVKGSPKTLSEQLLWGEPTIEEILHLPNGKGLRFEISPQAFFQPNTLQAEKLYSLAMKAASLTGSEIVFDLFCGAGTIGIFCSQQSKKVFGIELNASAIKNAEANAQLNHIENIEFVCGDVSKHLPSLPTQPDVVIVDPPRNGLAPDIIEQIAKFSPKRVVYVSCNPTTFARDAMSFKKTGYLLKEVQPVDMFPQTYHIECVSLLERNN